MKDVFLKIICAAGALNFIAFIAGYVRLGGDALSGKFEDGRYFLGNHGVFTEVSHATFVYSTIHAYSALLGLLVAGLAGSQLRRRGTHRPKI